MRTGFFDSISGNKSSARLLGFIIIGFALIFVQEVLYFGRGNIVESAIAAGSLFVTIAGPTLIYLYSNKQTEVKHEEVKSTIETIIP